MIGISSGDDRRPEDRYELLGELGRGGMATVHLARQLDLDRLVALKRLDALADGGDASVRRFVREARLAASLSHPNIVTVHDTFAVDGVPYIAMEYVPGGTLRELIVGLSLEQIAGVLDGVLAGLAHAERRHVVHRDLKPENLMVTAEGSVKITDFGIAKATSAARGDDGPLTTVGVVVGTPAYMAPEQAMAQELSAQTDLYATGIVAFELLAGRVPFRDPDSSVGVLMQHVNDEAPALETVRPGVDPALSAWVAGMLEKEPQRRPHGAAAARVALEDIVLRLCGPRWRREAPLPYLGGAAPRRSTVTTLGRAAPTTTERTNAGRRPPPVPAEPPPAPASAAARPRRTPRVATLAVVAGIAGLAIVAGAKTIGSTAPSATGAGAETLAAYADGAATPDPGSAEPAASPTPGPASAEPAASATPAAPATSGSAAASPAPTGTSGAAAGPAPAAMPVDAGRVADAERESARFAEEAQDTEGDGDEALTQQLRDAQYAYDDAVDAGTRGDAAGFAAALRHADDLARVAMARLDADN